MARTIDAYRGRLPLASADLVRYVYLAHAQCFNEGTFKRYSQLTSVGEIGCLPSGGVVLPSLLDRGFAEHMRTYFTRETYLAEHVRVQQLKIRMEPPAPYTWDPDPDRGLTRASACFVCATTPRPSTTWRVLSWNCSFTCPRSG